MGRVVANMSMSLDGFVADPSDEVGPLFDWYAAGPETVRRADPRWTFQVSSASAAVLRETLTRVGAIVTGRRLFDIAHGWGGNHPVGVPVFVVTHEVPEGWPRPDAPFTFVLDGVVSAIAQARTVAGDQVVAIASANITQPALEAGLVDEIAVDLVPVLLGRGIRWFEALSQGPVMLDDPVVVEGTRVTHLRYRVRQRDG